MAQGGETAIDLALLEPGLQVTLNEADAIGAVSNDLDRIIAATEATLAQAGVASGRVDALYFTGGSTGLRPLTERIAARFPSAQVARGDRFASVAQGLGLHARRIFA